MATDARGKERPDFEGLIAFRCPAALAESAEAAARRELISVSDYARRAVLKSLAGDGFTLPHTATG